MPIVVEQAEPFPFLPLFASGSHSVPPEVQGMRIDKVASVF